MNDAQLLQSFTEENSEAAFRTLVDRHLPLVFGTARRMTGDNALAEDIAQTVFILLAGKAKRLGRDIILSGWLYRTTRFVTSRALSREQRRRRREQEAVAMQSSPPSDPSWQRLAPQLDDALARLGDTDRNAILLRFFEQQQSLRDVGLSLGLSEEAAKKRVTRALEKLRRMLSRRGTEISAAALVAGLTKETAEAASDLPLAGKISAVVLAHGVTGASAGAGSVLLTDVLAALRWTKIRNAAMTLVALVAVALVLTLAGLSRRGAAISSAPITNSAALARSSDPKNPAMDSAAELGNPAGPSRALLVTVLDANTGNPIPGATLSPYVNGVSVPEFKSPFQTGPDGMARLPLPKNVPGGARGDYCEIPANAPGYVTRVMRWSSTTGMVLNVVSSQHTVRLSRGITLSGVVVDDADKPVPRMGIGAIGNNVNGGTTTLTPDGRGHFIQTPVVHQEDYSSYYLSMETHPVVTDASGRFKLENFPADVRALCIDLLGPDGALHKFQTPEGVSIHAETLAKVSLADLKNGAARLVIPRGITVQGVVVNDGGIPITGAKVVEAIQPGNIQVLSQTETDSSGHFVLSNRPPHEVILGASAEGSASLSAIVSIQPGMTPVRLQLPPELPMRGQVINQDGLALSGADISIPDYLNPGQYLSWSGKTDANGQFSWRNAPTNDIALRISASGYAPRIIRSRASTNDSLITLHPANNEIVRVTGHVTEADSGAPLVQFQMKISNEMTLNTPQGPSKNFGGSNGEINIELSRRDFPVAMKESWIMTVEAEGYDAAVSRIYRLEEGDQQLDLKLTRGGMIEGVVRAPAGEPAAGAQLAFTVSGQGSIPSTQPGRLSRQWSTNRTSANGQFDLKKPLLAENLLVFHNTGWALVPVKPGPQKTDVNLSSWARIEGTVTIDSEPAPNREIAVENLTWDYSDSLWITYRAISDNNGHFVFDKIPAGIFKLSCRARESGRWEVSTLQTSVTVAAGDTKSVELAARGRTVSAQLRAPPGFGAITWSNALATLSAAVQVPREPARSDFISNEAHAAARFRYAHDAAVLAALGRQKTVAGSIDADGFAVFQQVPPNNYILEVKLFDPSAYPPSPNPNNEPALVIARLRSAVAVPEMANVTDNAAPAALGEYFLDPL